MMRLVLVPALVPALVMALAVPVRADFDDGAAAAIKGDFATALAEFRPLAEAGHPKAQNNLGIMYQYGRGVAGDLAAAQRWYRKAAEQGLAEAHFNLGVLYMEGEGGTRDLVQAYLWLSLAAQVGDKSAGDGLTRLGGEMTADQVAEARRLLGQWRAHHGGE